MYSIKNTKEISFFQLPKNSIFYMSLENEILEFIKTDLGTAKATQGEKTVNFMEDEFFADPYVWSN